jgi:type II secretory pathway component PulK
MSTHELKDLLDQVADTREIVLRRPRTWSASLDAWIDAREEARAAYRDWLRLPTGESYATYRAAQDREDAAQDMVAHTHTSRTTVS